MLLYSQKPTALIIVGSGRLNSLGYPDRLTSDKLGRAVEAGHRLSDSQQPYWHIFLNCDKGVAAAMKLQLSQMDDCCQGIYVSELNHVLKSLADMQSFVSSLAKTRELYVQGYIP